MERRLIAVVIKMPDGWTRFEICDERHIMEKPFVLPPGCDIVGTKVIAEVTEGEFEVPLDAFEIVPHERISF